MQAALLEGDGRTAGHRRRQASVPTASQPPGDRERFERAAAEFVAAHRLNADRPETRTTLGAFYAQRGLVTEGESEYRSALRLNPQSAPAAINLADLYRQLGRDGEGSRAKQLNEALGELRRAAELDPVRTRYTYVYAVALNSARRPHEAIAALKANLAWHPNDRDALTALVGFSRDIADVNSALEYAELLAQVLPNDKGLAVLIDALRRQLGSGGR